MQEFQLAAAAGIPIQAKQSEEQRFALPDRPAVLKHPATLVKHSNRPKKHGQFKVEVSR